MELLKERRSVSRDTERVFGSDNECFMGQPIIHEIVLNSSVSKNSSH